MKNLCFCIQVPKQCCWLGQLLLCPNTTPHLEGKYITSTIYDHSTCKVSKCHQLSSFMIFMYLSRLGSKKILTCITQYQGHLPRVFLFKPPPQRKKGAGVSMGTKILVRPRDAEPTERSFVIGLVEDPEINGIDPPPRRQSSTDPLIPFFRSSETERRFFGGGQIQENLRTPMMRFFEMGIFLLLGDHVLVLSTWCCWSFSPVRWRSRPGHFTRSAGAITVLATAPEKRNFA